LELASSVIRAHAMFHNHTTSTGGVIGPTRTLSKLGAAASFA
jgi:hypothetical protein